MSENKKQYSEAEKKAYIGGKAYGTAKQKKWVKFSTKEERASFRAGVKAVREKRKWGNQR